MAITINAYDRLSDAAAALADNQSARFFGGGTFIMRGINYGDTSASTIIRSTDSSLREIRSMGTRIELGAGVTVAQILSSRELDFLQPVAKCIGGPAIRNMATLGGNLFARAPYGDFTTALLTLDCRVNLTSPKGQQELPLEDFLADIGAYRQKIVASLSIQRPVSTDAFRFIKISRVKPVRAAVITIAAHLPQSGGRIQAARVAYGAMSPRPMRIASVEQALEGKLLDDRAIAAAMAVATEGCHPATDPIASDWYRREVAAVHLRRLLGAKTN